MPSIDRAGIAAVEQLIRPYVRCTPVLTVASGDLRPLHDADPFELTLKLELMQHAGSFKARGAFANLLLRSVPPEGVVAASGGNHGVAVAYAAASRGVPATIFVPSISSPAKIERIRSYGARLEIGGEDYADALAASERHAAMAGGLLVHAFDQEETILGQGSLGLELEHQAPRLDTLLVPVGGGGLIAGLSAWYGSALRIIAAEPEEAPTLTRALEAGRPVDSPVGGIAADSLAPRRIGERNYPFLRRHVDRVVLISESAIRLAQDTLWRSCRVAAEPGGATALGALLTSAYRPGRGERVGVVVSGGNTTAVSFSA